MNWKLVLQLSLFGLAMGVGTVFFIPSTIEPFFWLIIFLVSAYLIATRCSDRHFVHGVAVGLANSVWVTGSHVLLFSRYIANHPREAAMMSSMPLPTHPRRRHWPGVGDRHGRPGVARAAHGGVRTSPRGVERLKLHPVSGKHSVRLDDDDAHPPSSAKTGDALQRATKKETERISELQRVLYADARFALLIVLQGRDASGKDGTIRRVFSAVNPQGCTVASFKEPTEIERRHDFLWRIHQQVPARGMITWNPCESCPTGGRSSSMTSWVAAARTSLTMHAFGTSSASATRSTRCANTWVWAP